MIEDKLPIPYEHLVGRQVVEPVLSEEIYNILKEATIPITHAARWTKWGMNKSGRKGTKLLLTGPPGCGKTTIARWLAKKVSNSLVSVTMADIGGSDPGSSERHIRELFTFGKKKNNTTIFFDECDALLWSREKAGTDSMWMIGVINQLLIQIESYEGLIILASNFSHILDPALHRRISYVIEVPPPTQEVRVELWAQKIPETYPCLLTQEQLNEISILEITGSEIETAIDHATRFALRKGRSPVYQDLYDQALIQGKVGGKSQDSGRTKKAIRLG